MLKSEYRPMTAMERSLLESEVAERSGRLEQGGCSTGCLVYLGVFCVVFLAMMTLAIPVRMLVDTEPPAGWTIYMATGPALVLAAIATLVWLWKLYVAGPRPDDLENGLLEVIHCHAHDALLVEAREDEGDGYFLNLGDDIVLFLQGDYLDQLVYGENWWEKEDRSFEELELEGAFPNRQFDVIRTVVHPRVVLAIDCKGERFSPTTRIQSADMMSLAEYEDGEIFHQRWDDLIAKVTSKAANSEGRQSASES